MRVVCDWRELNLITVKNKACLPDIDYLFDTVQGNTYFSKLDRRSGCNQIRINESDVMKTAIKTPFGHYQFRVMGFGLMNAPATFQTLMNSALGPYLRKFVVVFLDDMYTIKHVRRGMTGYSGPRAWVEGLNSRSMPRRTCLIAFQTYYPAETRTYAEIGMLGSKPPWHLASLGSS